MVALHLALLLFALLVTVVAAMSMGGQSLATIAFLVASVTTVSLASVLFRARIR
jgi:hypothetical protein